MNKWKSIALHYKRMLQQAQRRRGRRNEDGGDISRERQQRQARQAQARKPQARQGGPARQRPARTASPRIRTHQGAPVRLNPHTRLTGRKPPAPRLRTPGAPRVRTPSPRVRAPRIRAPRVRMPRLPGR